MIVADGQLRYRVNQSAPVGSYPDGASPYGCRDMVGNAYEWAAGPAKSYPGSPKPFEHKGFHFVRGGCWDDTVSATGRAESQDNQKDHTQMLSDFWFRRIGSSVLRTVPSCQPPSSICHHSMR